jgi:hypothetical protein
LDVDPAPRASNDDDVFRRSKGFRKAITLNEMTGVDKVLDIKFVPYDRYNAGCTIRDWVVVKRKKTKKGRSIWSPAEQLQTYWSSKEIRALQKEKNTKGYLVVIVGSRKILLWSIIDNQTGQLGEPELVGG